MTATADATDSSTAEQLAQAVSDLEDTVKQQAERIDELETELADYRAHNERDKAEIRQRVEYVREVAEEPTAEGSPRGTTPRKRASRTTKRRSSGFAHCRSTSPIANSRPTRSARFIAKDVRDYAEKAPAGLIIDSRTIKKVIAAAEGKRPHTQTGARVMEFLDELGKEDVELIKRRGKKLVVIDPAAADRLADHDRCDPMEGGSHPDGVMQSG